LHPSLPASFASVINLDGERFGEEAEVARMLSLGVIGEACCFDA